MADDGEMLLFTEDVATFGDRVTHAREAAGLTLAGLARRLGVGQDLVRAWEADQQEPRANQVQMMAGMLGVPLRWLLTGEGQGGEATALTARSPEGVLQAVGQLAQMRAEMLALVGRMGELEDRLRADLDAGRR